MAEKSEIVKLPWKREKDGLVADLGAVFRIERSPTGWECSVTTERSTELVNRGLPTQKACKQHAETYAAHVPEVAAALSDRQRARSAPRPAPEAGEATATADTATASGTTTNVRHPFERLDDGCIFGRAGGSCWVADERGVEFALPVDPAIRAEVEQVAAQFYAAAREEENRRRATALAKCQEATARQTRKRGAKGEPAAKTSVTPQTTAQVQAPVTWTVEGGEVRGVAAHGTFLVQPEGSRYALYFYEPGGQSRHLQSGDPAQLRKAAEELAARGQPALERETLSAEKEEALLRLFAAGAVGGP